MRIFLKSLLACTVLVLGAVSAVDAAVYLPGDIFAGVASGNVKWYRADGTFVQTLNIGASGYTTGMAFDSGGNLYVTGFSNSTVTKFDTSGSLIGNVGSGYSTPESILFDSAGNMFVGNLGNGIRKYDSSGTFLGTVTGISDRVDWFDLSADQSKFLYGIEGSTVKTVSNGLPGVAGPDFAAGLTQAFAMRILPDGGLLVADLNNVKRFNAAGTLIQTYDTGTENTWFSLNLNPDGTTFWSGNFGTANMYKFDIAAGGAPLQTINTGTGASTLYGITVYGEITASNPTGVPEPASVLAWSLLAGAGMLGVAVSRRRRPVGDGAR